MQNHVLLGIDATPASYSPFHVKSNLVEIMSKLIMTIDDKLSD